MHCSASLSQIPGGVWKEYPTYSLWVRTFAGERDRLERLLFHRCANEWPVCLTPAHGAAAFLCSMTCVHGSTRDNAFML